MKFDAPLRPFLKRLNMEAWLYAAFAALTLGAASALLTLLLFRLFAAEYLFGVVIGVAVAVACVTLFVTYRLLYRKSLAQAIRRIDEAGLQDRVAAMQEHWEDPSYLATVQREDTLRRLRALKPRSIRLKLPFLSAVLVFSVSLLTICVAALPPRVTRVEPDASIEDTWIQENGEVYSLADILYKKVDASDASDALKEQIKDIIDDISHVMTNPDGSLREDLDEREQAAELEEILDRLDNLIIETLVSASIGRLLQPLPETKALGDALLSREDADVDAAFASMKSDLLALEDPARAEHLMLLASDILGAIEASEAWEGNDLVLALSSFASGLNGAADRLTEGANIDLLLDEIFDSASLAVKRALAQEKENQKLLEDIKKDLEDTINDIMDKLPPSDKHINPDLDGDEEESGGSQENTSSDSDSSGGSSSGQGGRPDEEDAFEVWDPVSGTTIKLTKEDLESYRAYLDNAVATGNYSEEDIRYLYYNYEIIKEQLTKNP